MALELASSLAGLVGLAGLFVQSASSLYIFCRNVPKVDVEVKSVIEEIQRLEDLLKLLENVIGQNFSSDASRAIKLLEKEIAQCTADLQVWLVTMKELEGKHGKKMGNFVKTLKSAADNGRFDHIRLRLSSYREQFAALIGLLGM
jgi:hypothetical protein